MYYCRVCDEVFGAYWDRAVHEGECITRLIEATPDLIAALEDVVHDFEAGNQLRGSDITQCKKAIAKAKGESG